MNYKDSNCKSLGTYLYKYVLAVILLMLTPSLMAINYQPRVLNAVYPSASEEQQCLLIDKQGMIWMGSDGVTCYLPEKKAFLAYNSKNTTVAEVNGKRHILKERISAKSFTEDKQGNIYIGTWSKSLYRLDTKKTDWAT